MAVDELIALMKSGCAVRMPSAMPNTAPAAMARARVLRTVDDIGLHLSPHVVGNRQRAPAVERKQRNLVARAEFFLAADASVHHELDRRAPEARDGELEHQRVAEPRRARELAARVHDRKADAPLEVHLLERQPHRLAEPILDHAAHHVEEVDEVDDAGRIAVREADQPFPAECQRTRLNQLRDIKAARRTRTAPAAAKKALISVFFVSMTSRVFMVW